MPAGRPQKLTLDFFIHDASARGDRKVKGLRRRHGNDGYATYFILLEMLCQEPGLILNLSDALDLETAVEECLTRDTAHFYSIVQTCADLGLFDKQLWESDRCIFSHGLHDRYLHRLEQRRKEAESKQQRRKAEKIKQKEEQLSDPILKHSNSEIRDQNSEIRTQNKNSELDTYTELDQIHGHPPDNSIVRPDNSGKVCVRAVDPFLRSRSIPLWKTGTGVNDWNEQIVQGILGQLKAFNENATRADAIAFICKRENPEHPEHAALLARIGQITDPKSGQGVLSAKQQCSQLLRSLGRSSLLPEEWQQKTGATLLSELAESAAREYLEFLKQQEISA